MDELETKLMFTESLRKWALKNKITHCASNELLQLLRKSNHSYLPKDIRTFLETPINVNVIPMGQGQYWYNGLKTCLAQNLKRILNVCFLYTARYFVPVYSRNRF